MGLLIPIHKKRNRIEYEIIEAYACLAHHIRFQRKSYSRGCYQCGSRRRSTTHQILSLRQIMEKVWGIDHHYSPAVRRLQIGVRFCKELKFEIMNEFGIPS